MPRSRAKARANEGPQPGSDCSGKIKTVSKEFVKVGAGLTEAAVEVGSATVIYLGVIGFFMGPLLKMTFDEMAGEIVPYFISFSGVAEASSAEESRNVSFSGITVRQEINFNIPYPEGLINASFLLMALGAAGLLANLLARQCKKGSDFFRDYPSIEDDPLLPSPTELARISRRVNYVEYSLPLIWTGQQAAVLAAITFLNMSQALGKLPDFLSDCIFNSSNPFNLNILDFNITGIFNTLTLVSLEGLRIAARTASEAIDNKYFFWIYFCFSLAVNLKYAESKFSADFDYNKRRLQRFSTVQQLLKDFKKCMAPLEVDMLIEYKQLVEGLIRTWEELEIPQNLEMHIRYKQILEDLIAQRRVEVVVVDKSPSDSSSSSLPRRYGMFQSAPPQLALPSLSDANKAPDKRMIPGKLMFLKPPQEPRRKQGLETLPLPTVGNGWSLGD